LRTPLNCPGIPQDAITRDDEVQADVGTITRRKSGNGDRVVFEHEAEHDA